MKVAINVVHVEFYKELANEYLTEKESVGPCPFFKEGDTFLYDGEAQMPKDFCPWAWNDIYGNVNTLSAGGTNAPWYNADGLTVVCCTDGIRPVTFELRAQKSDPA